MGTSMDRLPDDIIIAVCVQVKRQGTTNTDLLNLQLVNKRWYQTAAPIMYRNIALRFHKSDQIAAFAKGFVQSKYGSVVRSLTLRIFCQHNERSNPMLPQDQLIQSMFSLPGIISRMDGLKSFSLDMQTEGTFMGYVLPRSTIAAILNALPQACTNLEIDERHQEDCDRSLEDVHICDIIRELFYRMEHLRIATRSMCAAMFGVGAPRSMARQFRDAHVYLPTPLRKIRTLVVHCGFRPCESCESWKRAPQDEWSSWRVVSEALSRVVRRCRDDLDARGARISITLKTTRVGHHVVPWTILQADMLAMKTWALPLIDVRCSISNTGSLRMPDEQEFVGCKDALSELAEGQTWKSVVGGARLPAEILSDEQAGRPSFATGCVEQSLGLTLKEDWKTAPPYQEPMVWQNDDLAGTPTIIPELRTGEKGYLKLRMVEEIVPLGWRYEFRTGRLVPA